MPYHALLARQIKKNLPEEYLKDENIVRFLEIISTAYNSYERDKNISEHAFAISDKEYQKLQIDLTQAKEKAERASKIKSEFMSNISHELRTPMNAIIGFTDLVLTTSLQNSQREYLQIVRKSGHHLLNIINDIINFSVIETGKLSIENTVLNLTRLVKETVEMFDLKAFEKGIEIISEIDHHFPDNLLGDPVHIRQILINLLGNAIKFTEKGEIVVLVKRENICYKNDNKNYQCFSIHVKDTGVGIPAEKLDQVFENFTQVDTSVTRKYGGTGLGLAIAKNLAEMMGGSLQVLSEINKGSTFILQLSLEIGHEQRPTVISHRSALNRVLVVDDNATNCKLMRGIFEYLNISSIICNSGIEALSVIEQAIKDNQLFDIILTDHYMPKMDGITLVRKITGLLKNMPKPFIIMLSSLENKISQQEAEKIGIDIFLPKPVNLHKLSSILESAFEKHKPRKGQSVFQKIEKHPAEVSILVAEDEPVNMFLISELLSKMGFAVIKAANGKEAVELLTLHNPALIFMDINMPIMDGYTAARTIRRLTQPQNSVPIIALTADCIMEDKERYLQAGINHYITKPFKLEDIEQVLRNYLLVK